MPATAPRAVRPRHHTPSSTTGESVDAATTNTTPTLDTSPAGTVRSATPSGTSAHSTADSRKERTEPEKTSWLMTPASETTSPAEVARNAAKAPATMRAVSSSPAGPGNTRDGSCSTTVSAIPGCARSGAAIRARSPIALDTA